MPPTLQYFLAVGPLARHVADLEAVLPVLAQADPRDPLWVPAPLTYPQGRAAVAVTLRAGDRPSHRSVAAGLRRAADSLVAAGYDVAEVEPPEVGPAAELWAQLARVDLDQMWAMLGTVASPNARLSWQCLAASMPRLDGEGYVRALAERHRIAGAWSRFQARYPLVLAPVSTDPPYLLDADLSVAQAAEIRQSMTMSVVVNFLGLPAVALCVGVEEALPQGVQLIAPCFREDLCLRAAAAIESALGVVTPIDPHPADRSPQR